MRGECVEWAQPQRRHLAILDPLSGGLKINERFTQHLLHRCGLLSPKSPVMANHDEANHLKTNSPRWDVPP
jgi:hypothetical protein